MKTVTSTDGTTIAYDQTGSGKPLVCISPALGVRADYEALAAELSDHCQVIRYDRRGRGDSTDAIRPQDAASYRIQREVDDLAAVIAAAGGEAAVLGYSSGARLALEAAAAGLPISKIALYEPPFQPDETQPSDPVVGRLAEQVAAGRPGEAVATFLTDAVGIPAEMVAGMRQDPMWPALEAIGQTVVYDATIASQPQVSEPIRRLPQPILVLAGEQTWPMLGESARYAAAVIDNATLVELPGGANHQLEAAVTAPAVRQFLG